MSLIRFIALWTHPDYAADLVYKHELDGTEHRLQTPLPRDYRNELLQFGLPRPTAELLDAIVDRESDLRDVADFLSPSEIVSVTEDWRRSERMSATLSCPEWPLLEQKSRKPTCETSSSAMAVPANIADYRLSDSCRTFMLERTN